MIFERKLFSQNLQNINEYLNENFFKSNSSVNNQSIKKNEDSKLITAFKKRKNVDHQSDDENLNDAEPTDDDQNDNLFKCRVEINNKVNYYKLKVMPYLEAIPTMYAWAPLQKNVMVGI